MQIKRSEGGGNHLTSSPHFPLPFPSPFTSLFYSSLSAFPFYSYSLLPPPPPSILSIFFIYFPTTHLSPPTRMNHKNLPSFCRFHSIITIRYPKKYLSMPLRIPLFPAITPLHACKGRLRPLTSLYLSSTIVLPGAGVEKLPHTGAYTGITQVCPQEYT